MIFPGTKESGDQAVVSRSHFWLFVLGFFPTKMGTTLAFLPALGTSHNLRDLSKTSTVVISKLYLWTHDVTLR